MMTGRQGLGVSMHDKIVAGAVTTVVVAPICAFCILGPAFVGSLLGGISGWIGGLSPVLITGLAIATGILVLEIVRRRRTRIAPRDKISAPAPQRAPRGGDGRLHLPRLEPNRPSHH